jgi:hypothetical protein
MGNLRFQVEYALRRGVGIGDSGLIQSCCTGR